MKTIEQDVGLFCRAFVFMLMMLILPMSVTSASAYSGGFFDDGLYDDDWYFDYYEQSANGGSHRSKQERLREYDAGQMYEEAEENGVYSYSGIFDY